MKIKRNLWLIFYYLRANYDQYIFDIQRISKDFERGPECSDHPTLNRRDYDLN